MIGILGLGTAVARDREISEVGRTLKVEKKRGSVRFDWGQKKGRRGVFAWGLTKEKT